MKSDCVFRENYRSIGRFQTQIIRSRSSMLAPAQTGVDFYSLQKGRPYSFSEDDFTGHSEWLFPGGEAVFRRLRWLISHILLFVLLAVCLSLIPSEVEALFGRPEIGDVERYPTDLEFARQAILKSVSFIVPKISIPQEGNIVLEAVDKSKNNWLIEECLIEVLLKQGYRVVRGMKGDSLRPNASVTASYMISYRIADMRLEYRYGTWSPLVPRFVKRRIQSNFLLKLIDSGAGTVLWSGWSNVEEEDVVPAKYTDLLRSNRLSERIIIKGENGWIEALVILGVVGSIVYILL
ncbi:MAG TPA: hypothetical protein EYP53_08455 [Candidatus Latescibacteria bacterium]|nr:hypothetical protein [Candidatus Latescibacterota bacterium]